MKYYSQYSHYEPFDLQESLSVLSKSNRWVKLADNLPWDRIEREYNKRLRNAHCGAGNKPARMVVGALIVKHVEQLSDEKTIQAIYRANDIRAKLDETAGTWIGACFFAKNVMKFLRGLLCLIFEICGFKTLTEPIFNDEAYLVPVLLCSKLLKTEIN